ncbi:hypothetical protein HXX76_007905 [Chlamydomonas incerta]|uniref:Uncharacterized protein n=1 Tax=Chlamydomonas incerta TaxID=51695 RepID=A0A835T1K3_CHLIN|nr:hypothetical protein HXX76_007905 [Chlamydomonas incerta]|eukprot:KAG2434178.1 hypothetical protein HXX76_007905 [Chlamydomonas incerta]
MSGDAIQSALTSTVRSFGVEGVTVAVADTQCTKGAELAFNVQLHCASADPELAAAVAQTLTGPAGVAAALAQLKRTTVGIFGEAGSVLLTQLKLEAVAVGSGSPSGSSASSAGAGGAALAAVASGGARDVGSGNVGSTSNAAAQSASVADVVSVAGSGSGGMAGTAGATEQAAQQTEAANSGQGGAAAVAAG